MGLPYGTMDNADAMLITATAERFAIKLSRIIDMDRARLAPDRPLPLNLQTSNSIPEFF